MQAWFRFLHIIGRPVDFGDTSAIVKQLEQAVRFPLRNLPANLDSASPALPVTVTTTATTTSSTNANTAIQISNYACVRKMPVIFLEVMKGVSKIVDSLLLVSNATTTAAAYSIPGKTTTPSSALTVTAIADQRLRSKSVYTSGSGGSIEQSNQQPGIGPQSSPGNAPLSQAFRVNPFRANRPNVNSLLHLVGQWLFEAALRVVSTGVESGGGGGGGGGGGRAGISGASGLLESSREFVLGQAEAYGILCRLFGSVKTNESVLPEYLSRFYALIIFGLKIPANLGEIMRQVSEMF